MNGLLVLLKCLLLAFRELLCEIIICRGEMESEAEEDDDDEEEEGWRPGRVAWRGRTSKWASGLDTWLNLTWQACFFF